MSVLFLAIKDNAVKLCVEPLHGILFGQSVREASTAEDKVEVHSVEPRDLSTCTAVFVTSVSSHDCKVS